MRADRAWRLLVHASLGALALGGTTQRVNLSSSGEQTGWYTLNEATTGALSWDGWLAAISSTAQNLVPGDTNDSEDVFVRDRRTGRTTRVSVSSSGAEGNSRSGVAHISGDGRLVAFLSDAANLVPNDTNGVADVFVHDRTTGETTRVSVDSYGAQANGRSWLCGISGDGRFVLFSCDASNLVPGARGGLFVHDRQNRETTLVNMNSQGQPANNPGAAGSISADGRFVAFGSEATNLVPDDTNGFSDIFVRDRLAGLTWRVSVSSTGAQANFPSSYPTISADGTVVAFYSAADNLVAGDTNQTRDVFVHDTSDRSTIRVSTGPHGAEANGWSVMPSISPDGRFVAFTSYASNLVTGDTNYLVDTFVHDRLTGETIRVSVDSAGGEGNWHSAWGRISGHSLSADGRSVTFLSGASNLVHDDTNYVEDVFVHDRLPVVSSFTPPRLGTTVRLDLVAGDPHLPYLGAASFAYQGNPRHPHSGAAPHGYLPGIRAGTRAIPLNPDPLFFLSLGGAGPFLGFAGTLDAKGGATASIALPPAADLAGTRLLVAFVVIDPGAPSFIRGISNALPLTLRP